jgi:oligopeptide/dipeptide ABC transporter ATP-binding protein
MTMSTVPILSAAGLSRRYPYARSALGRLLDARATVALDLVSLDILPGETLAIVGESGSGKTTLARCLVGLERPDAGTVLFEGVPLRDLDGSRRGHMREQVQLVFQGAHTALNPRKTIARSLAEAMVAKPGPHELARLLAQVALGPDLLARLPHELSGGQKQRVGIARALASRPQVLIADEPTSALDVSVQSEIVELLQTLQTDQQLTLAVITHDLGLAEALCRRVVVMFGGRIVESGATADVLSAPRHPYTQRLIDAVPRGLAGRGRRVEAAPAETAGHAGCPYEPRCAVRLPLCAAVDPPAVAMGDRLIRCHLATQTPAQPQETLS